MKVKKCVGCGFCCIKTICELGLQKHGAVECPELVWSKEQKRYLCNMVLTDPNKEFNEKSLYIGDGCCMGLNTWRQEVIPRRDKDMDKYARDFLKEALKGHDMEELEDMCDLMCPETEDDFEDEEGNV